MKWICVALTCLMSTAVMAKTPELPAGQKLDLFLLAGQSNMAGRGKVEGQDKVPDPNVWVLNEKGEWEPAIDPLHFDKVGVDGVGPGRSFGIALAKAEPGHMIGLIPCAVGGVSIGEWKPGGKLYNAAVRRVKIAEQHGTLKGILWHQGEADTRPERIAAYPQKLDALIAAFDKDLDVSNVPVVVGELGVFDPVKNEKRIPFNAMIDKYPDTRPNVALAKSDGFKSIGDNTHFDAASQREFGQRYAEAFLTLIHHPTTEPQ